MSAVRTEAELGQRILIVDDDRAHQQSVLGVIANDGYSIELASSGEEAIAKLKESYYDILLLDLQMPGISGFGVIDFAVKNKIASKIVVISSQNTFESAQTALRKGAYDFVKKPYMPHELINTVQNAASKKHLEDDNLAISQKLSESEYLHRFIVDHSPDIVFMLDTEGCFTFLNDTVYESLGYDKGELLNQHYSNIVAEQSIDEAKYVFTERRAGERKSKNVELKLKCRGDAEYRYFDTSSMSVQLQQSKVCDEGEFKGTYGVARDITEKKQAQELITFQAYHDLLTKLPNRSLMEDRLVQAISQAKRGDEKLAVMFLDLDRFKWVNDTMGHTMGDRLLQSVSQRLESCLRSADTLARFGGDEFALVLPNIKHHDDAAIIAKKILGELKDPFLIDEHELYVSGSVGIAVYPEAGECMETLIQSADLAMYSVKERGKNGYEFFDPSMNENTNVRLTVERELRRAIANGDLKLCYQPQVNAETEQVVGFEALIRWHHAEKGVVYPDDFIPVAEETGLIVDIGNFVLETACRDLADWRKSGVDNIRVSINCSAPQVDQEDFIDRIVQTLHKYGVPGSNLEIEITENVIMNNMAKVIQKLRQLTALGIKIAVDDFGTGYSSLSYLQHFPINTLKIDKSFVGSIHVNQGGTSIVNAIVAMAQGLNLNLVAEGVETVPQLEYLKDLGCGKIQGWLFGKAESVDVTREILAQVQNGTKIRDMSFAETA